MAEALLRDMAGDQFDVASAGTAPAAPHPLALQVLSESGFSLEGLQSKPLSELGHQNWDYVITLCDTAADECTSVCKAAQRIEWDFPDPVPGNRHSIFAATLAEIRKRIALFAEVHRKQTAQTPVDFDPVTVFKALGDQLRLACLLLIREQTKLCVCELTTALDIPQPKASRHLGILREAGLLSAERHGQWMYYSLNPRMPEWVQLVIEGTADGNSGLVSTELERLGCMPERPLVRFN